jgi:hypothetical protein
MPVVLSLLGSLMPCLLICSSLSEHAVRVYTNLNDVEVKLRCKLPPLQVWLLRQLANCTTGWQQQRQERRQLRAGGVNTGK